MHQLDRSDLCQSGLVLFLFSSHECWKKLLEQSCTNHRSIWPRSVRSCWKCLNVVQSIESLRVMRMVGSHVCTNRLRVHLESVHALMNFGNYFRWRCTLTWICCWLWCCSIENNKKNQKVLSPTFVDPWSKKMNSPNSSVLNPLKRDLLGHGFVELQDEHVFTICWMSKWDVLFLNCAVDIW